MGTDYAESPHHKLVITPDGDGTDTEVIHPPCCPPEPASPLHPRCWFEAEFFENDGRPRETGEYEAWVWFEKVRPAGPWGGPEFDSGAAWEALNGRVLDLGEAR